MCDEQCLGSMGCTSSMRVAQESDVNHTDMGGDSGDVTGERDKTKTGKRGERRGVRLIDNEEGGDGSEGRSRDLSTALTDAGDIEGPNGRATPSLRMTSESPSSPKDIRIQLNAMRVEPPKMSILLVFPNKTAQCDTFCKAAMSRGTDCLIATTETEALHAVKSERFTIIVIDTRPGVEKKNIHPEDLCRKIRASEGGEFAVIVAVRPQPTSNKTDVQLPSLIASGFNRQFLENCSVGVCVGELMVIELVDVMLQQRLRLAEAMLTAVDHSIESVDISSAECQRDILYVNRAFERSLGYCQDEVLGKSLAEFLPSNIDQSTTIDALNCHIKKGKMWEGTFQMKRKDGEKVTQKSRVIPVRSYSGKTHHIVSMRNAVSESQHSNGSIATVVSPVSGRARKESIVRLKSMSIETPISKVIFMLSSLRDNSTGSVSEALDTILDVLRSSELYHPILSQQVKGDKTTQDLVGGLMNSMDDDSLYHRRVSNAKRRSTDSDMNMSFRHKEQHSVIFADKTISPEVDSLLENEPRWDFDILLLERLTEKNPLLHLAMRTLTRFEVMEFLMVDDATMAGWLKLIESNYRPINPYHNSTHAADVMHATSYFLGCDKVKNLFDQVDEVAALLSAIVHDLDHPGKTNSFLINAAADVSLLYNDLAVLESHHVSTAYRLTLKNDQVNIFKNLARDDYKHLRQQVVDMVLATEMTKHFEHLNRFVSVVDQDHEEVQATGGYSAEAKTLIKRMLIKCADVSNPARPLSLCKEWAWRIAKEYCDQTDEEKARGLPVVMPVFDRKSCNVPKSQIGFIDLFIKDLFQAWHNFCGFPEMMKCVETNYAYWREQEAILAKSGGISEL